MTRYRLPLHAALIASAALISSSVAVTTGDAASPSHPAMRHACIDTTMGPNWVALNDHTILVDAGRDAFKVTTNVCPHLADALPRISTVIRGGTSICGPHDVQLYVSDSADRGPVPCFVQSIEPISLDQARDLRRAHH
jgi:hypothetical protein